MTTVGKDLLQQLSQPRRAWPARAWAWWAEPSTPSALRRVSALLVAACLLAAAASARDGSARISSGDEASRRLALAATAATDLYLALAEADALATTGFLAAGREPTDVRRRYDADLRRAGEQLVLAGRLSDAALDAVTVVATELPVYADLIEAARTYNRQGLPLGQSYLASASELMQGTILPAAAELRAAVTEALDRAYARIGARPWTVILLAVGALAAVADAAWQELRRTNRLLNIGLVAAGVSIMMAGCWWLLAWLTTDSALRETEDRSTAVTALDDIRVTAFQARTSENLVLVARNNAGDKTFIDLIDRIENPASGLLAAAATVGVETGDAEDATTAWLRVHERVRLLDAAGRYEDAVASATGTGAGDSGAAFDHLNRTVSTLVEDERIARIDALERVRGRQRFLDAGPALWFALAAVAASRGIAQRRAEYR